MTEMKEKVEELGELFARGFGKHHENDGDEHEHKTGKEIELCIEKNLKKGMKRLQVVFAKPVSIITNFVAPIVPKTAAQIEFIELSLKENFIFSQLSDSERESLIGAMEKKSYKMGTKIINYGDMGDYFYVIDSGNVQFEVKGKVIGTATRGGNFGEIALLYDCPRNATVIAETDVVLWRVDQVTVRNIKATFAVKDDAAADALVKVPFLSTLHQSQRDWIASCLETVSFKKGDKFIQKGDEANFYIIKDGKLRVIDWVMGTSDYSNNVVGPGEYFGEWLIMTKRTAAGDVVAESDGAVWMLSHENFHRILEGFVVEDLLKRTSLRKRLRFMPLLSRTDLIPVEYEALASLVESYECPKGYVIATEGQPTNRALYFVDSGSVSIKCEDEEIDKVIGIGGYFGDETLEDITDDYDGSKFISKYTVKTNTVCKLDMLTLASIESVIVDPTLLGGKPKLKKEKARSITEPLKKHRLLGAGTFGRVWLVTKQGSNTPYALKIQYKCELIQKHQANGVMREKNILASIDNDFIINLVGTHQSKDCLYMLMQFLQGGELMRFANEDRYFSISERDTKFYAACILEGLSYLHRRQIIHRDLKPENVMLDRNGYCVIIDLGFAKKVPYKTYTFCGTPPYMAPEVILNKGHNRGADIWSFGILLFEMVCGFVPFFDEDKMSLYKQIVKGKFMFPFDLRAGHDFKDLIKQLLVCKPMHRLGCFGLYDLDIRRHPWFKSIRFKHLREKKIKPPLKPIIKNPFDADNFEDWSILEKEKKKITPLDEEQQKIFKGF